MGSKVVPFLGLPCRILNLNPKKELLWSLWEGMFRDAQGCGLEWFRATGASTFLPHE